MLENCHDMGMRPGSTMHSELALLLVWSLLDQSELGFPIKSVQLDDAGQLFDLISTASYLEA